MLAVISDIRIRSKIEETRTTFIFVVENSPGTRNYLYTCAFSDYIWVRMKIAKTRVAIFKSGTPWSIRVLGMNGGNCRRWFHDGEKRLRGAGNSGRKMRAFNMDVECVGFSNKNGGCSVWLGCWITVWEALISNNKKMQILRGNPVIPESNAWKSFRLKLRRKVNIFLSVHLLYRENIFFWEFSEMFQTW